MKTEFQSHINDPMGSSAGRAEDLFLKLKFDVTPLLHKKLLKLIKIDHLHPLQPSWLHANRKDNSEFQRKLRFCRIALDMPCWCVILEFMI